MGTSNVKEPVQSASADFKLSRPKLRRPVVNRQCFGERQAGSSPGRTARRRRKPAHPRRKSGQAGFRWLISRKAASAPRTVVVATFAETVQAYGFLSQLSLRHFFYLPVCVAYTFVTRRPILILTLRKLHGTLSHVAVKTSFRCHSGAGEQGPRGTRKGRTICPERRRTQGCWGSGSAGSRRCWRTWRSSATWRCRALISRRSWRRPGSSSRLSRS